MCNCEVSKMIYETDDGSADLRCWSNRGRFDPDVSAGRRHIISGILVGAKWRSRIIDEQEMIGDAGRNQAKDRYE